jgi:hypothetical protein
MVTTVMSLVLAPGFGIIGNLLRRLAADLPHAVEAEEFALAVRRFDAAVGDEGESLWRE